MECEEEAAAKQPPQVQVGVTPEVQKEPNSVVQEVMGGGEQFTWDDGISTKCMEDTPYACKDERGRRPVVRGLHHGLSRGVGYEAHEEAMDTEKKDAKTNRRTISMTGTELNVVVSEEHICADYLEDLIHVVPQYGAGDDATKYYIGGFAIDLVDNNNSRGFARGRSSWAVVISLELAFMHSSRYVQPLEWDINHPCCPQQDNGHDCLLYVIAFMVVLSIKTDELYFGGSFVRHMGEKSLLSILQGKIAHFPDALQVWQLVCLLKLFVSAAIISTGSPQSHTIPKSVVELPRFAITA
ncbi:hypothetical protein Cgig2_004285 [Carnegiea gigantea]|uniref:Ubiquitin-like protease family profile domain-containing protein n=1 Tax=Carnegiea gigantea TaxID=171969 RepID=A0A9Q1KHJ9_9CARY|nr:hypothetical protein Cgig2_004285 [Carnegiea gigantea]